jgi:ABC-type methionine transport system permease subunit
MAEASTAFRPDPSGTCAATRAARLGHPHSMIRTSRTRQATPNGWCIVLVSVDPGVIEADRAMGASRFRIIWSVLIPEALGPLILGYTFIFIGVVDMSAMAGYVRGGGLGDFAISYGYQQFNWTVTLVTVVIIVQLAQLVGNWLARKALRR